MVLMLFAYVSQELLGGMHRSHVKRTMADIRVIADAWEARAAKAQTFDVALRHGNGPVSVSLADLEHVLKPTYIRVLPQRDAWNRELRLTSTGAGYEIRSLGRDGLPDHVTGATTNFECDIVYANGRFVEYPEGVLPR